MSFGANAWTISIQASAGGWTHRGFAELLRHLAGRHPVVATQRVHLVAAVVHQHVATDCQGVRKAQLKYENRMPSPVSEDDLTESE